MPACPPLTRTVLSSATRLEALRDEWDALLRDSEANEPTVSPTWMLSWWRVFGSEGDRALRSIAFSEGDRLVGLAPLLSRTASYRGGLSFRRLELLASGEKEEDETCSDYIGIIAAKEHERAVAESFADAAYSGELGDWDEIVLPSLSGEAALPHYLAEALRTRGARIELSTQAPCPFVPLPATWEKYLEALPARRRYLVRKSLRDFDRWSNGTTKLWIAKSEVELARAREVLVQLHRERWNAEGKGGVFESAHFREFHERVTRELLAQGALWLGWVEARGEPIAAFYNIVWNGTAYFYQGGRRMNVPKDVRPGLVMHASLIRAAIEAKLSQYDFLSGTAQYKMTFALATRPLLTMRAARPSFAELARRTVEMARGRARRVRDSILQPAAFGRIGRV